MNITNLRKNNIISMNMTMKLKSNIIIAFVVVFLSFCTGVTTQAQGIYSADANEKKAENVENTQSEDGGGIFRAIGDGGNAGGKTDQPGGPDKKDPIGEGILILSLLSGVYALVRRNVKRRNEV